VVILRRARPRIPQPQQILPPIEAFAPWGVNPIRPHQYQPDPRFPFQHGPDAPRYAPGGPPLEEFLNVIREVGCFAWSLVGINGNIGAYSRGVPRGEAIPPDGMPIWDPYAQPKPDYAPPENQAVQRWAREASSFHYPVQEENSRNRFNVGHGQAGSGHSISPANAYPLNSQRYLQANQQDSMLGNAEDQTGLSLDPNANTPPTTQGQGPIEGGRSNRDLWY